MSLTDQNTSLREQLVLLKKQHFGKSSEKLDNQISELEAKIEEGALLEAASNKSHEDQQNLASSEEEKLKNIPRRKNLAEHLERIDEVLNPDPKCPECGGEEFRKIIDDISESLEYIPSSFKVIRYIRPRCACINCKKIVQAYPASKPIAKGMAGAGLLSNILVQKYCNYLPFYRQSEIYAREDIDLSRSTMASWAGQCAFSLDPLVEEISSSIFKATHIHVMTPPLKLWLLLLVKQRQEDSGLMLEMVENMETKRLQQFVIFIALIVKGIRPESHLKDFSGTLHADVDSSYNNVYIDGSNPQAKITEASCWAHTRRKFYEVTVTSPNANIAMQALEEISKIYAIEEAISGSNPGIRYDTRQKRSKYLVDKLFISWKKYLKDLPKKSITGRAINYALNNEVSLKIFLNDGKIEIDNNAAERAMCSIALGRKNWLFAGSDGGGKTAASIYTITETAKLNGVNPQLYLKHVLAKIQDHNAKKIEELLPWNLKLNSS